MEISTDYQSNAGEFDQPATVAAKQTTNQSNVEATDSQSRGAFPYQSVICKVEQPDLTDYFNNNVVLHCGSKESG